jgi:hypothetical protein
MLHTRLDYAKLQRKRDKMAGPNGEAPRIDLETLRASARAADMDKNQRKASRSQPSEPTSPSEAGKPLPQQHHQGSFQLIPMMPPPQESAPPPTVAASEPNRAPSHPQQHPPPHQGMPQNMVGAIPPPPPWSTAPPQRGYAPEQLQHQSFLRTPHTSNNSPR